LSQVDKDRDFDIVDGQLRKYLGRQKHVIVPDGVIAVQEAAFENSVEAERVDFPDSVRILVLGWGAKVFAACPHLHTLKLGKNIEHFNLSLPPKTQVLFPKRFEAFYGNALSPEDTARLIYGLYCRNEGQARYQNFQDVVYVYLTHSSPKVTEKCMAVILSNLEECVTIFRKMLPTLEEKPQEIARRFLSKYDRLGAVKINTREEAEQYCRENYHQCLGDQRLGELKVGDEVLSKIRYRETGRPAPLTVSRFVFTQYMRIDRLEWDEACDQIAQMLIPRDLQAALETTYVDLSEGRDAGGAALFAHRDFMTAYCRFASPDQVRALKEKFAQWEEWGERGKAFLAHLLQALALNETLTALLLLDKLGKLAFAAKIRRIPLDKLRDSLIPDFGFDQDGSLYGEIEGKRYRITVLPDLSLEAFDMETGKIVNSLPPRTQIALAHTGQTINFDELKLTVKEIKDNQLAFLKHQFVTGATRTVAAWRRIYAENLLLRKFAASIIWSYSHKREKETFRIVDEGSFIDVHGSPWLLPEAGNVSVAHPLNLTGAEIASWSKQLRDAGICQPIGQLSEPVIPFSSLDDIKNRYAGIVIPFGIVKYLAQQGYKIYGSYEHGYEADNNIVRLHFDFGVKIALNQAGEEDPVYIRTLTAMNLRRTRAINHSLAVLDRLPILKAVKNDEINHLIEYIENKNLGLDEDETEAYLNIANKYQSFKCMAELMDYKNKHFRFNAIQSEIKL